MVKLLLSRGANINAFDKKDRRALHWAAYMGKSPQESVYLHYISSASLLSTVCCGLVSSRLSHFRVMSIRSSALMVRVSLWQFYRKDSCISLFSRRFFLVCVLSSFFLFCSFVQSLSLYFFSPPSLPPRRPLSLLGHMEVVRLLVSHGAEVVCKDKKGYTPLHAAASSGMISVVKYLLDLGVEVSFPLP